MTARFAHLESHVCSWIQQACDLCRVDARETLGPATSPERRQRRLPSLSCSAEHAAEIEQQGAGPSLHVSVPDTAPVEPQVRLREAKGPGDASPPLQDSAADAQAGPALAAEASSDAAADIWPANAALASGRPFVPLRSLRRASGQVRAVLLRFRAPHAVEQISCYNLVDVFSRHTVIPPVAVQEGAAQQKKL